MSDEKKESKPAPAAKAPEKSAKSSEKSGRANPEKKKYLVHGTAFAVFGLLAAFDPELVQWVVGPGKFGLHAVEFTALVLVMVGILWIANSR